MHKWTTSASDWLDGVKARTTAPRNRSAALRRREPTLGCNARLHQHRDTGKLFPISGLHGWTPCPLPCVHSLIHSRKHLLRLNVGRHRVEREAKWSLDRSKRGCKKQSTRPADVRIGLTFISPVPGENLEVKFKRPDAISSSLKVIVALCDTGHSKC